MTVAIEASKVEELASQGLTMEQIASCLGCAPSTLYLRVGSESEVSEAIKKGRANGVKDVSNALYKSATGGNITAQIFYLKNRSPEDWSDRKEITGANGGPIDIRGSITLCKPGD